MTTTTDRTMKPWQKRTLITLFIIFTLVTLVWNLIPTATKWFVNRYTQQHGVTFSADTINPNLFPIGLELNDIQLTRDNSPLFSLNEASIGLDFIPLVKGELHVNHIMVNGFDAQVEQHDGVMTVAGIPLPASTESEQVAETQASDTTDTPNNAIPTFYIRDANIQDIQVHYISARGEDTFYLNALNVVEVSHNVDDWLGQLSIEAGLNNAKIEASGEVTANSDEINTFVDLDTLSMSTEDLRHFIPNDMQVDIASNISLNGSTNVVYQHNGLPQLVITSPLLALTTQKTTLKQLDQNLSWEQLNTTFKDVAIEQNSSSELSANAKAELVVNGLSLNAEGRSMSTKSLSFNAQSAFKKNGNDVELSDTTGVLEVEDLQGEVDGNSLSLAALSSELQNIALAFNIDSQQGQAKGDINVGAEQISAATANDESFELSQLTVSAPLDLNASESEQKLTTNGAQIALSSLNLTSSSGMAQLGTFALELNNTEAAQSTEGQRFATSLDLSTNGLKAATFAQDNNATNTDQSADIESLTLQSAIHGALSNQNELNLESAASELQVNGMGVQSVDQTVSLQDLNWTLNNLVAQLGDNNQSLAAESGLKLADLKANLTNLPNDQPDTRVTLDNLALNNSLNFSRTSEQTNIENTNNSLNFNALTLEQANTLLGSLEQFAFGTQNVSVALNAANEVDQVSAQDNTLNINDLDVALDDGSTILSWNTLALDNPSFALNGSDINADVRTFNVQQLVASKPNTESKLPALATFDQLDINRVSLRPEGVEIGSLVLDKLTSGLVLASDQNIENLMLPSYLKNSDQTETSEANAGTGETTNDSANVTDSASSDFYIVIGKVSVSPESTLTLTDHGIVPTLNRELTIDELTVDNLNTRDAGAQTYAVVKVRNGRYASLDGSLTIEPSAEKLTMDANATIREVELPPISPYVSNVLGYNIDSGQLNMDLNVAANQGQLNGNTHIVLRQFDLGGKRESNTVLKAGAIPLNLAVGALKDRDDNIVLDLPLKGDISSPQFQWQNFFLLPVRQGLYKASSMYVMQTFVPYANVISLAQLAGEQVLRLRVQPLNFPYGETEMSDAQEDFLTQLTALMNDRPDAELRACGVAVAKDIDESMNFADLTDEEQGELYGMANERAENLKAYLVDNDISSNRIFICSPNLDENENATPRVTLTF